LTFFQLGSILLTLKITNLSFGLYFKIALTCFLSSYEEWFYQLPASIVIIQILPSINYIIRLFFILSAKVAYLGCFTLNFSLEIVLLANLPKWLLKKVILPSFDKEYAVYSNFWLSAGFDFFPFLLRINGGVIDLSKVL
jgi:hypothetical protein